MKTPDRRVLAVLLGVSAALYLGLCYGTERTQIAQVWACYYGLFALYLGVLLPDWGEGSDRPLWAAAVVFRVMLLAALPQLSDDIWRFVWDGRLWAHGLNPFALRPVEWAQAGALGVTPALDHDLYAILASRDFFASYPPLTQVIFGATGLVFPTHALAHALSIKAVIIGFDLLGLWAIRRLLAALGKPERAGLWYALNPLVIIELSGNGHFDAAMISLVLLSLLALVKGRTWLGAVCLGLAMAVKPFPIVILPLLVRRLGLVRATAFGAVSIGVFLLGFVPMLGWLDPVLVDHYRVGLTRFFQTFEFNASVYYLMRAWGYYKVGFNTIAENGRLLPVLVVVAIFLFALLERRATPDDPHWSSLPAMALGALTIYWFGALVVHPWYTASLVALGALGPWRFPMVWSAAIPLTYIAYSQTPFEESMPLVAVEYALVVGFMVWEARRKAT